MLFKLCNRSIQRGVTTMITVKLGILALLGQVSYPRSFPRTRVHDRVARSMHRAPWSSHYMFTGRIRYFSLHYEPGRVIYEVQYFYLTHQNVFERSFVHFIKTYIIGGSRGGREGRTPPPGRPNSFDFMQFSGKFGVFTPPLEGSRPPPRENPGSATVHDD